MSTRPYFHIHLNLKALCRLMYLKPVWNTLVVFVIDFELLVSLLAVQWLNKQQCDIYHNISMTYFHVSHSLAGMWCNPAIKSLLHSLTIHSDISKTEALFFFRKFFGLIFFLTEGGGGELSIVIHALCLWVLFHHRLEFCPAVMSIFKNNQFATKISPRF